MAPSQCLVCIGNIAGESPTTRDAALAQGVMEPLLHVLSASPPLEENRSACWTLANLCRGKPPPDSRAVEPVILVLPQILSVADTQALADACWCACFLSESSEEHIKSMIDAGAATLLVGQLSHAEPEVLAPALRAIGNFSASMDEDHVQFVIDLGTLAPMRKLLTHESRALRRETLWTLSNILAGSQAHRQAVTDAGLLPSIVAAVTDEDAMVRKEALWAVSNAITLASAAELERLADEGALSSLVKALDSDGESLGEKLLNNVVEALGEAVLQGRDLPDGAPNRYLTQLKEAGGEVALRVRTPPLHATHPTPPCRATPRLCLPLTPSPLPSSQKTSLGTALPASAQRITEALLRDLSTPDAGEEDLAVAMARADPDEEAQAKSGAGGSKPVVDENDVEMVMSQAGVSRARAIEALNKSGGDPVFAILESAMF